MYQSITSTVARPINRFNRRNGAASMTASEPMTLGQIRQVAPSVFAEGKHNSRSGRYAYIPTSQIVEHLMTADYGVFSVAQSGSKDEEKRCFTKHVLRLRPLSQLVQVGGTHNEIVLMNSHDGTSSYRLMAGVFRLVCGNGLVVSEGVIEDVRVMHFGNILEGVSDGVERLKAQLPRLSHTVEAMQQLRLSSPEQQAFARSALLLKYEEGQAPISADQALATRRQADVEPTLWNTFNTVQEALVRGGHRYIKRTDRGIFRRTTSPVNSVSNQTSINRALWQLAEEMRKIKASN